MPIQELTVQVNSSDHLSTQPTLDGELFRIDFYTTKVQDLSVLGTAAIQLWYVDIYDSQGSPLVFGIGMVAGIDILFPYRALPVPKGKLFVAPATDGPFIDPTRNTFADDDAHFYYQTEADAFPS